MDFDYLQKLCAADLGVTDAEGFLLPYLSQQKSFVVGVAVGAVETHSAEGVARNGSRHDGKLQLPHHAPRRAQSLPAGQPLRMLGNEVFDR